MLTRRHGCLHKMQSGYIRYLLISIEINRVDNTIVVHNDFEVMLRKNKIKERSGGENKEKTHT